MGSLESDTITVPGQAFACLSIVGPTCPQKTDQLGIKIRGCFSTNEEARRHAKKLQEADGTLDIYVVEMFKWLLIPPDPTQIENVEYPNAKLQEIMSKYQENQRLASAMFEERKRGMMAKPLDGVSTPYIQPGDENSKFYTKPDVPPLPHPADLVDEIRKENPDISIEKAIEMADKKVDEEIKRRAAINNGGTIIEEDESGPSGSHSPE
jgi:hypothetical protein